MHVLVVQACLLSLQGVAIVSALPQVNQEIDTEEDLLAIDSFSHEISVPVPILPPPGFAGLGDRFIDEPKQPASQAGGFGDVTALVHNNKLNRDGSYAFNYQTSDGQSRNEQGQVTANGGYVQTGGWEYIGADGKTYKVTFVADENGFRPVGHHIPSSPTLAARRARFLSSSKANRKTKQVFKRKTENKAKMPRNGKLNRVETSENEFSDVDKVTKERNNNVNKKDNNSTADAVLKDEDSVVAEATLRKNKVNVERLRPQKRRNNQQKKGHSKKKQANRNRGRKSKSRIANKSAPKKNQNKGRFSRRGRRVRLRAGEGPAQRRKLGKT